MRISQDQLKLAEILDETDIGQDLIEPNEKFYEIKQKVENNEPVSQADLESYTTFLFE